ncbi:MAG TPA: HAD family acid phosphatase [Burkholderiales bacterium]|nr:HAD family acid phosphatase [Burkholderiales bacterium]
MPQRALFAGFRNSLAVLAMLAFAGLAPAVAQTQAPEGCYPIPEVKPLSVAQPLNIDLIKQQLLYYRCTHYDSEVAAVFSDAQRWVQARAPQVAKPAIVLDIDETSLSNWTRIKRDDFGYIQKGPCDLAKKDEACSDEDWQKTGLAPALQPALDLVNAAKCAPAPPGTACTKAAVFFVTGRTQSAEHRKSTETNLTNAGYRDWDGLYMRDPATHGQPVSEHKTKARIDIESKGFTIIANIGDQDSDLAGEHAERKFKVPNPFYFIP